MKTFNHLHLFRITFILTMLATTAPAQTWVTNGLVAYYPFNGNANDASGNGNSGTMFNLSATNGSANTANSALYFNGSSGYAQVPNVPALNPTNMTLCAWIKPDAGISSLGMIFSKHEDQNNNDGSWWLADFGQYLTFWGNGQLPSQAFVPSGVWTHCVFTYNSTANTWAYFLNGSQVQTGTYNLALAANAWPLNIGAGLLGNGVSPAYFFQGAMDNLRVYNRTLSSMEVAQLFIIDGPNPLYLTQDLTNTSVILSSNTLFVVSASSSSPLSYQWYFSSTNLPGQAGAYAQIISHFVYAAVITNAGSGYGYMPSVSFIGGGGSGAAGYATVSNGMLTSILVTNAGSGYTSVPTVVIGAPNGYLSGQTNSTLNITNASPTNAGTYYVVVANNNGSITSSVASLTILYPPDITTNPAGFSASLQGNGSLDVSATGTPPLYYQWILSGTNIPGATNTSFIINDLNTGNAGSYSVEVTNAYGYAISPPANVELLPSLTSPFTGAIALWGQDTILQVGAVGSGTLDYQWYFNGQPISGANASSYALDSIQFTNAGLYSVVVSSMYGSVTNVAYQVVVNPENLAIGTCPIIYITGTIGYNYTIQSTTNLANSGNWVTLTNITLSSSPTIWADTATDTTQSANPRKFYRVVAGQ